MTLVRRRVSRGLEWIRASLLRWSRRSGNGAGHVVEGNMERPVYSPLAFKCRHSTIMPSLGEVQARVKSWQEIEALVVSRSAYCQLVRLKSCRLDTSVMYVVTHQFNVLYRDVETATATISRNTAHFQSVLEFVFISNIIFALTHVRRPVSPGLERVGA